MVALAYRDGVDLSNTLNFQRVTVETDCHNLVQLWETRQHHLSEIMGILRQIQEIASQLLHCNLIFVRREANFAAHLRVACGLVLPLLSLQDVSKTIVICWQMNNRIMNVSQKKKK